MPPTFQNLDEHAFQSLFKDHFTGLCQFASGYLKDSEAAKEIVQDVFVSLWLKRDTIDSSKPVKSYLSTSVRNRCINYLRDHKKFSSDLLALENLSNETMYEQPDTLVESDLVEQIDRAIEELPEKCRQVFKLSRHQNLKYQQIADQLQISVKTVETQMSKALQHMRHRLAEYLPQLILLFSLSRYLATSLFDYFAISPFLYFAISLFRYFAISFFMVSG
jgi:RNA polymerase sigma-70 factor (ECF subfamily)